MTRESAASNAAETSPSRRCYANAANVYRSTVHRLTIGNQRRQHADLLGQIGQVIRYGDERRRKDCCQIVFRHFVDGLLRGHTAIAPSHYNCISRRSSVVAPESSICEHLPIQMFNHEFETIKVSRRQQFHSFSNGQHLFANGFQTYK